MIISASRRTDIPAFYAPWFFNRLKEKYVLVPNPYNPKAVSRVSLDPAVVDCIVFWTKNPRPMISKTDRFKEYNYYFQFTLNPYGKDIENHIPTVKQRIEIFKRLSDKIGPDKVVWRYDPILTNAVYNVSFHKEAFAQIAEGLNGYTRRCMLGFIDHYHHIRSTVSQYGIKPLEMTEIEEMAVSFKETMSQYPAMEMDTCTNKVDLRHMDIPSGMCIDKNLIEKITGYNITARKDKNQRHICNCVESIDIGTYESCLNGCIYCYAIKGKYNTAEFNSRKHDKNSPMLIGNVKPDDIIKDRPVKSLRDDQFSLF